MRINKDTKFRSLSTFINLKLLQPVCATMMMITVFPVRSPVHVKGLKQIQKKKNKKTVKI